MAEFPCPNERIAASALLLLSTITPPSISRSILRRFDAAFKDEDESIGEASKIRSCRGSLASGDSKSSASSEQSDVSTEAISARATRIVAFAPDRHEMKLKVVRKTRSKTQQISGGWKFASGESYGMASSESVSAAESSSCLTAATNSSAGSSVRSRNYVTGAKEKLSAARGEELRRKAHIGSTHMRRRAEGILNILSGGCFSEVTIRRVLGDSPDTSKALRILLKLEKVKRSGTGGRRDPYIYMIA